MPACWPCPWFPLCCERRRRDFHFWSMNGEAAARLIWLTPRAAGENCANRNKESNTYESATSPTLNLIIAANLIVGCSAGKWKKRVWYRAHSADAASGWGGSIKSHKCVHAVFTFYVSSGSETLNTSRSKSNTVLYFSSASNWPCLERAEMCTFEWRAGFIFEANGYDLITRAFLPVQRL